ncbi:transcriptional regulatory protein PrrA [Roseivivax marinus]|uniref:Transcriptional regulatory protein PrrA n=1 Tax=Roseivivax marinus TaxID=1379903 RepID=W4HJ40_9RHOB|nr:response regulator transcription factor [Roseivivax marinus]ETW12757.1 transcriptional regulatory protein PrrA [Roseivivax marinus]UMA64690.1 response regulator transcription factor [Roseivivax marinus]
MTGPRILIVDDDPEITSALERGLALHGYDAVSEHRTDRALARLRDGDLCAAIVDVMLGGESGLDLVRAIRTAGHPLPVVMLSALAEVEDRAAGLEAGADDYIVKPFSFEELVARLKVQERRAEAARPRPATIDARSRQVIGPTRDVTLTQREFDLLAFLCTTPGEPLSRGAIFDALWGADGSTNENVVDVYLGYLRRKLDPSSDFGFEIKTVRNRGFLIEGIVPVRS